MSPTPRSTATHGHDSFLLDDAHYHGVLRRLPGEHRSYDTYRCGRSSASVSTLPSSPTGSRRASRVLDLGCGDGTLLAHLSETRGVQRLRRRDRRCQRARAASSNGINVIQINLEERPRRLRRPVLRPRVCRSTLQTVRHTERILREMLRVGREAVVTFPNFAYWKQPRGRARGPHAGFRRPALPVVRHAERALLHAARLRGSVRQDGHRVIRERLSSTKKAIW